MCGGRQAKNVRTDGRCSMEGTTSYRGSSETVPVVVDDEEDDEVDVEDCVDGRGGWGI